MVNSRCTLEGQSLSKIFQINIKTPKGLSHDRAPAPNGEQKVKSFSPLSFCTMNTDLPFDAFPLHQKRCHQNVALLASEKAHGFFRTSIEAKAHSHFEKNLIADSVTVSDSLFTPMIKGKRMVKVTEYGS